MVEIQKMLQTKTKKELINIMVECMECNKPLKEFLIDNYLEEKQMSGFEQTIVDKLTNSISLQKEETDYCLERLKARENVKVGSVLKSTKKFDSALVNYKLEKYFSMIWSIYPRRVGKDLGKKAFYKLISEKKLSQLDVACKFVIERVKEYIKYCENNNTEEQYILHLSTFCNSKKYLQS